MPTAMREELEELFKKDAYSLKQAFSD